MPIYDRKCNSCEKTLLDRLEKYNDPAPDCECGGKFERFWSVGTTGAYQDDIPGGIEIRHGICNEDGSPRRYYSKSEMKKEAEKRGLVNKVRHVGGRGTDKSKNTTRWW